MDHAKGQQQVSIAWISGGSESGRPLRCSQQREVQQCRLKSPGGFGPCRNTSGTAEEDEGEKAERLCTVTG